MKSRSDTASIELRDISLKSSCFATHSRSIGYGTPAIAPDPSGITSADSAVWAKRVASRSNISKYAIKWCPRTTG